MFPITTPEFKLFFLRDNAFEYQPYPTWTKTVWDTNDICLDSNLFYKSLVDLNALEPINDDPLDPKWVALCSTYISGNTYSKDDVVYYSGNYYVALENTSEPVTNMNYWRKLTTTMLNTLFPDYRVWAAPTAYKSGDSVIAIINYKVGIWTSNADDNYTDPAVNPLIPDAVNETNYWTISDEEIDFILDSDIDRAMQEASFKFNPSLFSSDKGKMVFLYLTAFFLVYDRLMGNAGMNGNSAAGPVTYRSVGKMSVSYMESKLFEKYPSYEFLSTNDYGRKAFNLMLPFLRGNVQVIRGSATPE